MQRVLSMQTGTSSGFSTGEFVTKRLCCSVILTVTFFAVLGGFFLGRFVTNQTHYRVKQELSEISKKIKILDSNLKSTFHATAGYSNCSALSSRINCEHFKLVQEEESPESAKQSLDILNHCFSNG